MTGKQLHKNGKSVGCVMPQHMDRIIIYTEVVSTCTEAFIQTMVSSSQVASSNSGACCRKHSLASGRLLWVSLAECPVPPSAWEPACDKNYSPNDCWFSPLLNETTLGQLLGVPGLSWGLGAPRVYIPPLPLSTNFTPLAGRRKSLREIPGYTPAQAPALGVPEERGTPQARCCSWRCPPRGTHEPHGAASAVGALRSG